MNMASTQELSYAFEDTGHVARKLAHMLQDYPVITFTGPLGAGKTTLIKALASELGVADLVTSPTYTYLNTYEDAQGKMIYHFDLYRLGSAQEFESMGFGEYLYADGSWALIEWPEIIAPLLARAVCHVVIDYDPHDLQRRIATVTCVP
jgi:tRNA threonylcarbamoyladenosine biosynthesis protein TsaE